MGQPTNSPLPTRRSTRSAVWGDRIFHGLAGAGGFALLALIAALILTLYDVAQPTVRAFGFGFLFRATWDPQTNVYGASVFIVDTLLTSAVGLLFAVPLSLGAAIFLTQHAPAWLGGPVSYVIELLAAVPSVVFGFWGVMVLVPYERYYTEPALKSTLGWTGLFSTTPIGLDVFTASLVLAIMTVPTITAISRDSLRAVPTPQKEGAMSLGATSWETTRRVLIPFARSGIFGGIILGLGRALGETMAVLLVIGNADYLPKSLISPGQTLASKVANEFTEASGKFELSGLIELGLVLLLITFLVNVGARAILWRFQAARGSEIG